MRRANIPAVRRVWPAIPLMVAALVIMVAAAWYANHNLSMLIEATDQRARARQGRLELEQALSLFKDLESGSRGYVISGRESYLAPYVIARTQLPIVIERLRYSVGINLPSEVEWVEIDALMRRRLEIASRVIESRKLRGVRAIRDTALFDEGKRVMDLIRKRFARIDEVQGQRIAEFNRIVHAQRRRANISTIAAGSLAIVFLSLGIYLLSRERAGRLALESQLRETNAHLEARVRERTAALSRAKEQIASFALEQDRAIELERRRLSREVHDQIGQVFTAIKLILGSLPGKTFPPDQEAALAQALEAGIATTRRITAELRPPLLDDLGLGAALNRYARESVEPAGIRCDIDVADEEDLDVTQSLALFRISQEAVTNILRHAHANSVEITGHADSAAYVLTITDDGRGFAPGEVRPGAVGLMSMQERAQLLGGEYKICTRPGSGTTVEIHLPLRKEIR